MPEQRWNDRKQRMMGLLRGAQGNMVDNRSKDWYIREGEEKLGAGYNNIVLTPTGFYSNILAPGNPGFTFESGGSYLRAVRRLVTDVDIENIRYGGGRYSFNPLIRFIPPNIVNYYPVIISILPLEELRVVQGAMSGITSLLKGLSQ